MTESSRSCLSREAEVAGRVASRSVGRPAARTVTVTVVAAIVVVQMLSRPAAIDAAILPVTDCGDTTPGGAPGQLRRLITDAAPGDTIVVPACTIVLTGTVGEDANAGGDLDVSKDLTIQGAGRDVTIIDGASRDRVFHISPAGPSAVGVVLSDMTIENGGVSPGAVNQGGGIRNAGTLTLLNATVRMNAGGTDGGGIYNDGVLVLTNSTVSDNAASTGVNSGNFGIPVAGGGIYNNAGLLTITSSTVSGNAALSSLNFGGLASGGGIQNAGGVVHIVNSTISGNTARGRFDFGGGIENDSGVLTLTGSTVTANLSIGLAFNAGSGVGSSGVTSIRQTIVAKNARPLQFEVECAGTIFSNGWNLSSDASCSFTGLGDLMNTDPLLGSLADNGGPTQTHSLLAGSPAVDVSPCFVASDQRGVPRPQPQQGGVCDIGAFEVVQFYAGGVFLAVGQLDGAGPAEIVTGSGNGGPPRVRAFNADGSPRATDFQPYFSQPGGVRVATCDFNGDGRAEIVTAPGPVGFGQSNAVRIVQLDGAGVPVPGGDLAGFIPYDNFLGGIFVACGDVDGDGIPDVITGADAGGGPHVRVFKVQAGAPGGVVPLVGFFAFAPGFTGGVRVAAGNVDGSDRASIVVGAGPGGGPHVRALKFVGGAALLQELASFFAYAPGFAGGVFVAAGDVSGDGRAEIVTGAGAGGGPHVRVFTGTGADTGVSFFSYAPAFSGGVRVAVGDVTGDGVAEILTAAGPGGGPHVRAFSGSGAALPVSFFAY